MEGGLHGARPDAEHLGDLGFGEVEVEAQNYDGSLAVGEPAHGCDELVHGLVGLP